MDLAEELKKVAKEKFMDLIQEHKTEYYDTLRTSLSGDFKATLEEREKVRRKIQELQTKIEGWNQRRKARQSLPAPSLRDAILSGGNPEDTHDFEELERENRTYVEWINTGESMVAELKAEQERLTKALSREFARTATGVRGSVQAEIDQLVSELEGAIQGYELAERAIFHEFGFSVGGHPFRPILSSRLLRSRMGPVVFS